MHFPQIAGRSLRQWVQQETFQLSVKSKSRGTRVEQFLETGNTVRRKTQVVCRWRMTIIVESKLLYELRRHT